MKTFMTLTCLYLAVFLLVGSFCCVHLAVFLLAGSLALTCLHLAVLQLAGSLALARLHLVFLLARSPSMGSVSAALWTH